MRKPQLKRQEKSVRQAELASRKLEYTVACVLASAFLLIYMFTRGSAVGAMESSQLPDMPKTWVSGLVSATGMFVIVLLNAILVGCETAVQLLKPVHVRHLREQREKDGRKLQELLDRQSAYVAACRLGSDLCRLLLVLFVLLLAPGVLAWVRPTLGWQWNYPNLLLVALLIMVPIGLVNLIAELVPKSYASIHPHGVALRTYGLIRVAAVFFRIPAKIATSLANLITARFGGKAGFTVANQAEEEIKTIVETAQESGEIEVDEKELLHSVFEFTDTVAREVMTPRVDLDAVPVGAEPEEVLALIRDSGHSRIPLYEESDDQIVGIIHAKDLFMAMLNGRPSSLRSLMRPALFVPENKNLHELLAEMRGSRSQMAVVQDEFGGTAGIVTIEDIVEELVGDIVDEYDVEEPEVVQTEDGWIVSGKLHIDDLNDEIGSQFSSEEFDTVGGMVFGLFGRQPKADDQLVWEGHKFCVVETDGRRIHRLLIQKTEQPTDAELVDAES